MKKYIIGLSLCLLVGCGTTPIQKTVTAEGVTIASVDTGMKVWADWVNQGKATQKQVDTVKQAYNAYYTSQAIAKAAIEEVLLNSSTNTTDISTANAAEGQAATALINLIQTYTSK